MMAGTAGRMASASLPSCSESLLPPCLAPAAHRAIPSALVLLSTPMDHPCYKCGHSVEDGKPFCLECGAPQIRVAMPEPAAPVAGNVSSNVAFNEPTRFHPGAAHYSRRL